MSYKKERKRLVCSLYSSILILVDWLPTAKLHMYIRTIVPKISFSKISEKLHQEIKYLLVRLLLLRCPRWLINSANNAKRSRLFLYNHRFNHSRSSTFRIKLFEVVRMPDNLGILTEAALILLFSYPYFA